MCVAPFTGKEAENYMLKNLIKNKNLLIVLSLTVLIVIVILVIVFAKDDTDNKGNSGTQQEQEQENVDDNMGFEEVEQGGGLEVKEEDDDSVNHRTDVSGLWGDSAENETSKDTTTEKENNENNTTDGEVLVDDKDWGRIY